MLMFVILFEHSSLSLSLSLCLSCSLSLIAYMLCSLFCIIYLGMSHLTKVILYTQINFCSYYSKSKFHSLYHSFNYSTIVFNSVCKSIIVFFKVSRSPLFLHINSKVIKVFQIFFITNLISFLQKYIAVLQIFIYIVC